MLDGWYFFFFKQKTAYEMRISDWSSDVCSSDLIAFSQAIDEFRLDHRLFPAQRRRAPPLSVLLRVPKGNQAVKPKPFGEKAFSKEGRNGHAGDRKSVV